MGDVELMTTYEFSVERGIDGPHAEFCFIHEVFEWSPRIAYQCFECKHIFTTMEALVKDWNETAGREGWRQVKHFMDVPFCPHCLHDL
jgi:hypothetical protein